MACSGSIIYLMRNAESSDETISFIFDRGAVTVSFGQSFDESMSEMRVISWGVMQDYVRNISSALGGTLY